MAVEKHDVFSTVELSSDDVQVYEQLANSLVRETLHNYDRHVTKDKHQVDSRRWKPLKRRDNVVVYKDRKRQSKTHKSQYSETTEDGPASPRQNADNDDYQDVQSDMPAASEIPIPHPSMRRPNSHLPKLLAVGTIAGTLDDVMYGVVSTTTQAMRMRTSFLEDAIADGAVLHQMKGPSPAEPFRFLGIKWLVKDNRQKLAKKFVRPRDLILLEYSGVLLRPNGDRIGFHLLHSVTLAACRELTDQHILRAKLSSCYLYKEVGHNEVDVFMKARVEPGGHVLEMLALRAVAGALTTCRKSSKWAQSKKLAHRVQSMLRPTDSSVDSDRLASSTSDLASSTNGLGDSMASTKLRRKTSFVQHNCSTCNRPFSSFSRTTACQLCHSPVCSRCRQTRQVCLEDEQRLRVSKQRMVFCKLCIYNVYDESSLEVAKEELLHGGARVRASSIGHILLKPSNDPPVVSPPSAVQPVDRCSMESSTYEAIISATPPTRESSAFSTSGPLLTTPTPRSGPSMWNQMSSGPSDAGVNNMSTHEAPLSIGKHRTWSAGTSTSQTTRTTASLSVGRSTRTDEMEPIAQDTVLLDDPLKDMSFREYDLIHHVGDDGSSSSFSSLYQELVVESDDEPDADELEDARSSGSSVALMDLDDGQKVETSTVSDNPGLNAHQLNLLQQMNNLQSVMEHTYKETQKTTNDMVLQTHSSSIGPMSSSAQHLRRYAQPFHFHVVGLESSRSMTFARPPTKPPS